MAANIRQQIEIKKLNERKFIILQKKENELLIKLRWYSFMWSST